MFPWVFQVTLGNTSAKQFSYWSDYCVLIGQLDFTSLQQTVMGQCYDLGNGMRYFDEFFQELIFYVEMLQRAMSFVWGNFVRNVFPYTWSCGCEWL